MVSDTTISAFLEDIMFNEEELEEIKEATKLLPSDLKRNIRKTIFNQKIGQMKRLIHKIQFFLERGEEASHSASHHAQDLPPELASELKEKDELLEEMAQRMNSILEELRTLGG